MSPTQALPAVLYGGSRSLRVQTDTYGHGPLPHVFTIASPACHLLREIDGLSEVGKEIRGKTK